MSSIVFRDLSTSASTSRSSSPWQQGGLSPGLAMFATTTFGGEPLRVLANVDEELGAAHMGPRIYKRHNQKHVRNKVRAKIDASHAAGPRAPSVGASIEAYGGHGRVLGDEHQKTAASVTAEEQDRLRRVDLQNLVDECRRCHNLWVIERRSVSHEASLPSQDEIPALATLLAAIHLRLADPQTWTRSKWRPILSSDLLPVGLQEEKTIDFSVLPSHMLLQIRQSVLQALSNLLGTVTERTHHQSVQALSHLLALRSLRPISTDNADLKPALQQTFLHLLDTFRRLPEGSTTSPDELLSGVLKRIDQAEPEPDALIILVGELVGLCGQQMSSDPTILTETQDRTLVSAASFLSLCFALNSTRPAATRLPAHAFYCTVLDLAPFLEHFVHHAASFVRSASATGSGMAKFNICRWPFLLSLGAKVRILQLENEVRLSRTPLRESFQAQRFSFRDAELVVGPTSLSLRIERDAAWEQSKSLLLQLLESGSKVRGLRVEFAGEQAADGGGPAREWFATVSSSWSDVQNTLGSHGWFVATSSTEQKDSEDTAAFLGMLLALAALHTTKLSLPFSLPAIAFKIATAPKLDALELTPVDLEFADAALAKSLQSVLDWTLPDGHSRDEEDKVFDSTFSLTWSTHIKTAEGEIKTMDLVPGGRHRSVRLGERREYVSKLIWRVLIGSVSNQVMAFRDAWQSIMPSHWLGEGGAAGVESASDVVGKGGLALSLFSAEEISQAIVSIPASASSGLTLALDIADIKASTDLISPSTAVNDQGAKVVEWFWETWSTFAPLDQRRLLAFVTGAQDLPASGARGVGLRIHLVIPDVADHVGMDARWWPLPWSSTCTSTLFLPVYPERAVLEDKLRIAIEHYQGFGLR